MTSIEYKTEYKNLLSQKPIIQRNNIQGQLQGIKMRPKFYVIKN